jgi:hypothetical protein
MKYDLECLESALDINTNNGYESTEIYLKGGYNETV